MSAELLIGVFILAACVAIPQLLFPVRHPIVMIMEDLERLLSQPRKTAEECMREANEQAHKAQMAALYPATLATPSQLGHVAPHTLHTPEAR